MTVGEISVLFPGQGAYFQGALTDVGGVFPGVGAILEQVDAVSERMLGARVSDRLVGPAAKSLDELLVETPDLLQLAIYTTSVAAFEALRARGARPRILLGHSFGEIAALVCAGAFSVSVGAEIVCHRSAALRSAGVDEGKMAALGAGPEIAERVLALVADPHTVVAVENHADQTVVSGPRASIEKVGAIAAAAGIGAQNLKSPYAFHSPVVSAAAAGFAERIRSAPRRALEVEVFSPILMRTYRDDDDLVAALADHLTRRVRFADAVRAVHELGVGVFVEAGALDALTTIARRVIGAQASFVPLLSRHTPIDAAFGELAAAGALETAASGTDALRRTLAPATDPAVFESFWRAHGARFIDQVRRELGAAVEIAATSPATPELAPVTPGLAPVTPGLAPVTPGLAPVTPGLVTATPELVTATDAVAGSVPANPSVSRHQILRDLRSFYADTLEYPVEVFDENTDLEAELGVDSVKQTELLGRVREQYGLPARPDEVKISEHNTLGRIADLIIAA
ncbi:acyltransferase domain-containing protein [Nocardia bovistercoris]|uniref:[acyl-carrier-protein] S-malonyltransferase n=1 Tax=Nocardia bovistercoris TaxID=2785916 RepID=A0A931IE05_9NOCA|nr:acyltransferase domain-containing protein [Nocardia bovistercoris]MBH0778090.1 acyltransferase domain-containing protein [Nocardia bovistercoris]